MLMVQWFIWFNTSNTEGIKAMYDKVRGTLKVQH